MIIESIKHNSMLLKSREREVFVEAPAVGVVVGLLKYITHQVLLVVFLLYQPHVQLHLTEKTTSTLRALLPLSLRLTLTRRPFQEN